MKYYILAIVIVSGILTACGGSKKIVSAQPTKDIAIAEKDITERKAPEVETDIIDTPNTPIEEAKEEIEEKEIEASVVKEEIVKEILKPLEAFDHTSYGDLVVKYVSPEGNVDYDGFKRNWGVLRTYIKALGENMPTDQWTKEDKLAYWMNAYNAMTVDLILRNYPLASIKDIKDPWGQRFWKLGQKYYNLNEIEHKILRKMGDARIHFGINCASFSCPPLLNEAFTAQKVDTQLDALARRFVNDTERNTITANSIEISEIFNWFAKDFKTNGSVIDFLNKYSDTQIASNAKRRYKDYNWSLNK
ncbi:DUF547 domain-containing protein [Dokdonia sp.]|uniref:DUF547 domain-containing protein n=1 Tax=Dokdonia sp. TaxID=2024995 RepID=UPI00326512BA